MRADVVGYLWRNIIFGRCDEIELKSRRNVMARKGIKIKNVEYEFIVEKGNPSSDLDIDGKSCNLSLDNDSYFANNAYSFDQVFGKDNTHIAIQHMTELIKEINGGKLYQVSETYPFMFYGCTPYGVFPSQENQPSLVVQLLQFGKLVVADYHYARPEYIMEHDLRYDRVRQIYAYYDRDDETYKVSYKSIKSLEDKNNVLKWNWNPVWENAWNSKKSMRWVIADIAIDGYLLEVASVNTPEILSHGKSGVLYIYGESRPNGYKTVYFKFPSEEEAKKYCRCADEIIRKLNNGIDFYAPPMMVHRIF